MYEDVFLFIFDNMNEFKGKLLVAQPRLLSDHFFSQSVIFITDEHEEGKVGFIINRPTPILLTDVLKDIKTGFQIWQGGPVSDDNLYYLHQIPELLPGSIRIDKDYYWGGDFEALKLVLNQYGEELTGKIKFFLGYSGWAPGQLEHEIKDGAWFVLPNMLDIFNINPKNLWKEMLIKADPRMEFWKNAPVDPSLN